MRTSLISRLALALLSSVALVPAANAIQTAVTSQATGHAEPAARSTYEGVADLGRFKFEQGGSIDHMKVGYVAFGTMSPARDNVILLLPETSATRHAYDALIGPGKTYDTNRFYIVVVDQIGGGQSSRPSEGLRTAFPRYTIRDMVRVQHDFVRHVLKVPHLVAVGGASMGSFQTIEWGVTYPNAMDRLILIVPAARSDGHLRGIVKQMRNAIAGDADYADGRYGQRPTAGLRQAARIFFPWLRSDAYLAARPSEVAQAEAQALGDGWADRWDPTDILWRYNASAHHDVSQPFGGDMRAALSRVRAPSLIISSTSDRTIPAYLTDELRRGLGAPRFVAIETDAGHAMVSARPESADYRAMANAIATFLAGSTSASQPAKAGNQGE